MTNETKHDVFEVAMNHATKTGWVDYGQLLDRYNAALPDDLPVIPEGVGAIIRRHREAGRDLTSALYEAIQKHYLRGQTNGKSVYTWITNHQDTFALAWLLGDWEVEE